jgi:hypothetical protein
MAAVLISFEYDYGITIGSVIPRIISPVAFTSYPAPLLLNLSPPTTIKSSMPFVLKSAAATPTIFVIGKDAPDISIGPVQLPVI